MKSSKCNTYYEINLCERKFQIIQLSLESLDVAWLNLSSNHCNLIGRVIGRGDNCDALTGRD
jgi:hypothetical protein